MEARSWMKMSTLILGGLFLGGLFYSFYDRGLVFSRLDLEQDQNQQLFDHERVLKLAKLKPGTQLLQSIKLSDVEAAIKSDSWVKSVEIEKRFPGTLYVKILYKVPQAVFQSKQGSLFYIDEDSKLIGKVSLAQYIDLPILYGFEESDKSRLVQALRWAKQWKDLGAESLVSSIGYSSEQGFRMMIVYGGLTVNPGRVLIELGEAIDLDNERVFQRLKKVIVYLSSRNLSVRQIFADSGKRIIVRKLGGT